MKVFFFDIAKQFMHVDDFSFVWIFFFFFNSWFCKNN